MRGAVQGKRIPGRTSLKERDRRVEDSGPFLSAEDLGEEVLQVHLVLMVDADKLQPVPV